MKVPNDKVGLVIGKGGQTIKGIQQRTGTDIQVPPFPDSDDPDMRTVNISAMTQEAADAAQNEIFSMMSARETRMGGKMEYVSVPDDRVSAFPPGVVFPFSHPRVSQSGWCGYWQGRPNNPRVRAQNWMPHPGTQRPGARL